MKSVNPFLAELSYFNFHQLEVVAKFFKWVKITHICLIWGQAFANLDVETLIPFPITVIWSASGRRTIEFKTLLRLEG